MKKYYTVLLIQLDGNLASINYVESREPCNLSSSASLIVKLRYYRMLVTIIMEYNNY